MNIVDRVIASVSPVRAVKRMQARQAIRFMNSGYGNYGASRRKKSLMGWTFGGGSSKEDIEDNLPVLRQRCRDLYMGAPLATSAIKTCRTNVVGSGLKLKSTVDYKVLNINEQQARELETQIEREFALWADSYNCDLTRLDNFYELQQLAFLNWLLSGDVIATLPVTERVGSPYDIRIHLIEADRLSNPSGNYNKNIIGGVETNEMGEVIAYHISKTHPLSYGEMTNEWVRIEAFGAKTGRRNIIHIMNRERIGQRRGVPFLAPVIEALKQLSKYTEAELVAAVVSGMFTIFIEKGDASEELPIGEMVSREEQVDPDNDSTIELAPGAVFDLNEGEKAHDINPGRPNTAFDGFVKAVSRQIGSALEIPHELLTKEFTSSYSASRGALLEAWKMFKMYRTWLAADFCQPIYEEWLSEAIAKGRIKAPGYFTDPIRRKAFSGAEWNGPAQGLLNPVQEVNAAEKRVANGFSTRSREAMEMNGSDFHKNADQLKREEKIMEDIKSDVKKSE